MKRIFFTFSWIFLVSISSLAQEQINQMDAQGRRHGFWKKTYPDSQQIRYEGTFEHGKEVGTFKFYCEDCGKQPTAVSVFSDKDASVWVQYFTIKGKLVSEGKMINKEREGEWVSYHEKSNEAMSREFYRNGKLEGKQTTYYPNGKITEELQYVNGIKEGENLYYSPEGVLIKKLKYHNDQLDGPATYYDAAGNVVIEGFYQKGKKHGLWRYYKNGQLELEETYPKPLKRGN
ncbi:MAG: toxin-antitoxin system YwqK family antitoxin [Flavobacteriaceae bacterium]